MKIIDRTHWYKQKTRSWYQRAVNTIKVITVHHTADQFEGNDDQTLTREAQVHINNGWPGLSYHYFICRTGNIYKINNHSDVTWHDAVNWDSIGIALMGYFHPPVNQKPTEAQLKSLKWLLDQLSTQYPEFPADQNDVYGHRERSATACPGDGFWNKVVDYRKNNGNVSWGEAQPDTSACPAHILRKSSSFDKVCHFFGLMDSDVVTYEQIEKLIKEYKDQAELYKNELIQANEKIRALDTSATPQTPAFKSIYDFIMSIDNKFKK